MARNIKYFQDFPFASHDKLYNTQDKINIKMKSLVINNKGAKYGKDNHPAETSS